MVINVCGREKERVRARHIRTSIWIYRKKHLDASFVCKCFSGGKLGNLCSTAPFPYKSSIIYIIMHNWNWFRGPNGYSLARLDGQSVDAVAISSRNALGAKMNIIRWDARIQFPVDTHTHTHEGATALRAVVIDDSPIELRNSWQLSVKLVSLIDF